MSSTSKSPKEHKRLTDFQKSNIFQSCFFQERLTRLVSISLVGNPNVEKPENPKRKEIISLCQQVSAFDPEFICKVRFTTQSFLREFYSKQQCGMKSMVQV